MKKLIQLSLLLFSIITFAQNNSPKIGTIKGAVIDATTQESIAYATVSVHDDKDELITGGISSDNGNFELKKLPLGSFTVKFQFIGYEDVAKKIELTRSNKSQNLGNISLKEGAEQLDAVEVIAESSTIVQKIDRKVINVGKDLTSAGTTASELLNNVQSVSVDSQTGNISLRGNENVRVLVDGKPSNMSATQLLKQIPSTSIKQIELITNPSAKYNPEGMSGMINIILHKNSNQGFNGSINTGVTQGENTRFNGSLDMNYKTGKVNLFTNYGLNTGKSDNFGHVNRFDNNSLQDFVFDSDNKSHLLKIGTDIYLNEKNTLSFYTIQNFADNFSDGTTRIFDNNVLSADSFNTSDKENTSSTYNVNYKLDFNDKGHNLELEANFSRVKNPEIASNGEFLNLLDFVNNYETSISNKRNDNLFNIDYTKPIGEKGKLELGAELRTNKISNSNNSNQHRYLYDNSLNIIGSEAIGNSTFDYDRNIYSGYATYGHKFGKLTMQLGARLEQYDVNGEFEGGIGTINYQKSSYEDDIFSIYPSAFFTYNPSEKNQFQISYSRRVDRPSLQQVNPIREWSTPRITSVGNPNLRPQFTNSYELNYTRRIKNGSLTFGTFYRKVNDNITRVLNTDPLDNDKVLLTHNNTNSNNRYGVEASANYKVAKWWRLNASTDLYIQNENGIANGDELEVTNNAFNARISNSFTASKKLRFQLFTMYRGGSRGIQFKVDPMWMVNTGASYSILKGRGTINARVNDIFKGMKFAFESENPYQSKGQFNWESRTAYLGFMYRFGGGKNKARSRKRRDNNEKQGGGGFM